MSYRFNWPKDKAQREESVAKMVSQGKSLRNPHSIRWWIANLYLQGLREFTNRDYENGTVSVGYLNSDGVMKFRNDEIVAKYMSQLGRLLAIDLAPKVKKKGISLDGVRKSSVAQVVLDSAMSRDKIDEMKMGLCPALLMYGTVGVGLWVEGPESQGIEVIMPWELLPIPVDIAGPTGQRGLMRIRPVPVEWLKGLAITPSGKSKTYKGIEDTKIPVGNMPSGFDGEANGVLTTTDGGGGFFIRTSDESYSGTVGSKRKRKDELNVPITLLVETWTETSEGYLADYGVYAGITKFKELYTHDHTAMKYPMPIRVIRDIPVGSFWGRSYVDLLIPINNEIEFALSSIFEAVADFDLYGLQLWPTTLGTPTEAERGQDGIKRLRYEPDYTCPDIKPSTVEPAKMTSPMIQAVTLATNLMDRVANQPQSLMSGEGPGRVDSASGLGLLYETSGIPLSPTAKHISAGIGGCYRALLRILKDQWTDQKVVSITSLDDSLAGIVVNAANGSMELSQNTIPYPDEVEITVASELPTSSAQLKAELKEALTAQRINIDEYNQAIRKQALDLPAGDELGWQSYRRAVMENIILFGDGKKPGQIKVSQYDVARVHETVLLTFMARPEYYLAETVVREAFEAHLTEHRESMGTYPDQLPYSEDSAEGMLQGQEGMDVMPPMQ